FSVPMGLIGVFWALYLTDTTLSSTSFMGIIMMVGIVVSNGVLLVEYINELRRHGMPVAEAVPRAGRVRLRPILMTVFATVVGLLPMAFAFGVGTEANQPLAILMASLGVAILGLVALDRLPVDLFPNINLPIINVGTIYTGAGVLDIEKTVTYPIEKAVSAVSDVRFVESKSRQGLSTVRIWMNWGADVNNGQTEVIQRIQQILNSLPTGIKQPFIVRYDLSNIPVVLVTVAGGGLDERQLYDLAYNTIEPQLERLAGVASASIDGGKVRQITV